jgi:hypothetical protein
LGKKEKQGGSLARLPSSSSPTRYRTERRMGRGMAGRQGGCRRLPSRRRPGNRGKRERRARGTYSRAHLELLRTVEAVPRGGRGRRRRYWWRRRGARRAAQGCSVLVRCGEVVVVSSLNRRRRSVRGRGDIFPARPPASSGSFANSGRLPAATGDATARSGTGQRVQGG